MRDDIKEYNAVENVARKFCEAVKSGKSEIVKPYFEKGNIEQNNKKLTSGNIKANMKINKFDTKIDTVSFSGNYNKPAKGLFEKFIDILNYPIKKSKENKLKKAAEEAAKQARLRTSL